MMIKMISEQRKSTHGLHLEGFSRTEESLLLARKISDELTTVALYVMSMGDDSLLQRAGVYVSRDSVQYRFNRLQRKVSSHLERRRALIEIGNRYLSAQGAETVAIRDDYGPYALRVDSDAGHINKGWDEQLNDAYKRMQAGIEAVEADVSRCQDMLIGLQAWLPGAGCTGCAASDG